MRLRCGWTLVGLLLAAVPGLQGSAAAAAEPDEALPERLTLGYPAGGCWLGIGKDGRARLAFGAAPHTVAVRPDSFDYPALVAAIRARLLPLGQTIPAGTSVAAVTLGADSRVRFLHDTQFAQEMLQRAWGARVLIGLPREQESMDWVGRACGFSGSYGAGEGPLQGSGAWS